MDLQGERKLSPDANAVPPGPEECLAQVDRLVASPLFLGSEALCKLLKYLTHHTLHTPADHLKEYRIATEVFGRSSDFDPQTDSYVRVQMGRLRSKLMHYYETEGARDTVLVAVPKGRYLLSFERLTAPEEAKATRQTDADPDLSRTRWRDRRLALAVLAGVVVVAIGAVLALHFRTNFLQGRSSPNKPTDALSVFWDPFIQSREEPIVVFANADFVGDAETGMRYFNPSHDPQTGVTQRYTGVGEVMGVLELDRLLRGNGHMFRVKRGSLFTLDDARDNNLIFVGSPTENLKLGKIPGTQDFVFRDIPNASGRNQEVIVDAHPPAGANSVFAPSDERGHEGVEFAVVALRHGLDPARWTMILAGTSTVGTQAAVSYVCNAASVGFLLKQLNVSSPSDLKPFEALLRVKVANDVPLDEQLIALRQRER